MSNAKHTPAPWKALSNGMVNTKSGLIAAVYAGDSYLDESLPDKEGVMRANTALIAAAPDLLSEARAVLEKVTSFEGVDGGDLDEIAHRLRAVIAKAEGRA